MPTTGEKCGLARIETLNRKPVTTAEKIVRHEASLQMPFSLAPGRYRLRLLWKDVDAPASAPVNDAMVIEVP